MKKKFRILAALLCFTSMAVYTPSFAETTRISSENVVSWDLGSGEHLKIGRISMTELQSISYQEGKESQSIKVTWPIDGDTEVELKKAIDHVIQSQDVGVEVSVSPIIYDRTVKKYMATVSVLESNERNPIYEVRTYHKNIYNTYETNTGHIPESAIVIKHPDSSSDVTVYKMLVSSVFQGEEWVLRPLKGDGSFHVLVTCL